MTYTISQEDLNKVFAYLGKRPYVEVFELVTALQQNVKAVDSDGSKTPEPTAPTQSN